MKPEPSAPEDLLFVTCSIPSDLGIFSLLARSMDECIENPVRHIVAVPGKSVAQFRPYQSARREIVAQEDVLPFRLYQTPAALRHLSFLARGFRRPIYFDGRLRAVRGWIIQQLLKIEISRQAAAPAVMHIDSDVFFFRDLGAQDVIADGKPHFFGVTGGAVSDTRRMWTRNANELLGTRLPAETYNRHHVENCVPWSSDVARRMVAHIEKTTGKPYYQAMIGAESMSEYHIYGIYLDHVEGTGAVHPTETSFCNSVWPKDAKADVLDMARQRMVAKHRAISVQSTLDIPLEARVKFYEAARAQFAGGVPA